MSSKSITSFFKASKASIEPSANLCGVKRSREEASAIETREQGKEEPCVERDILPVPVSWLPLSHLDKSWRDILQEEFNKSYFKELTKFVDSERSSKVIYPPVEKMFNAFNICPYESVKVVIIGQDPYHGPSQAHGLAFSVEKGVPPPPSLKNIFKEAQSDVNIRTPSHGNLENWGKQGVLLLNTSLTVRQGEANSHQKRGWEEFTDAVVRALNKRDNIVYLLWGKPAQLKCANINRSRNHVITSSHPSPLGAAKTSEPFLGSKCFSRCNKALEDYNKTPINWNV